MTIYLAILATIAVMALIGIYGVLDRISSALSRQANVAERQARMWEVK